MEKLIDKLFRLYKSPLTTPYNLLENALLPNYEYVKYYKRENGLTTEMKCSMDDVDTIFYYHFDLDNNLQVVEMEQDGVVEIKFNRKKEFDDLRSFILENDNAVAGSN